MTKNIKLEPARYGTTEERVVQFEKLLLSLEGLFEGYIFHVRPFLEHIREAVFV
jgi:hypothetical protein